MQKGKKVKPFFPLRLYLFALFAVFNHEADTCKYIFLNKTVKPNIGKNSQNRSKVRKNCLFLTQKGVGKKNQTLFLF